MSDSPRPPRSAAEDIIVCEPTKWFLWRVVAMLVMFTVFAVLFLKDGIWGYREANLQFFVHEAFVKAGTDFQQQQEDPAFTPADWQKFAAAQRCQFPEDAELVLPREADLDMPWPQMLVDGYALMKEEGGQNGAVKMWESYTSERGWDLDPGEHHMDAGKIKGQFIATSVVVVLILVTLFILVRTLRRSISADHECLNTQEGVRVLYSDMIRVDKRKWDTKGIALVYYMAEGEERKARIDGMVYGQFKEEDGAPAEKLFSRVMDHFKGEVLEYVEEEEDEAEQAEG